MKCMKNVARSAVGNANVPLGKKSSGKKPRKS